MFCSISPSGDKSVSKSNNNESTSIFTAATLVEIFGVDDKKGGDAARRAETVELTNGATNGVGAACGGGAANGVGAACGGEPTNECCGPGFSKPALEFSKPAMYQ